jgi:hypothetical protein
LGKDEGRIKNEEGDEPGLTTEYTEHTENMPRR